MPTTLPYDSSQGKLISPISLNLACEVAITPTGLADGSWNVSWSVNYYPPGATASQLAGGSLKMQPADHLAKVLYQVRGGYLEALKNLTMQQVVPPASQLAPGAQTGLPAPGASFFFSLPVDLIAGLPSNPANVGV
jgi:hypothetical protein